MYAQVEKPKENKSSVVANSVAQKKIGGELTAQFVVNRPEAIAQRKFMGMANNGPLTKKADQLNSLDNVKVHRNSDKPAQLQAHANAQGTNIHLKPGQERHLPHETWHVVQKKHGRVKPTLQLKEKVNVNNDAGLEAGVGQPSKKIVPGQKYHIGSGGNISEFSERSSANNRSESVLQMARNIFFDATRFHAGLNPVYDPTQTHFSYLDDVEIGGAGGAAAAARENLHVTFQDVARIYVTYAFYTRETQTWRFFHNGIPGGGGAIAPFPYPGRADANLNALLQAAIDFAWPPINIVERPARAVRELTNEERQEREEARQAHEQKQRLQAVERRANEESLRQQQVDAERRRREDAEAQEVARKARILATREQEDRDRAAFSEQQRLAKEVKKSKLLEKVEREAKQQAELQSKKAIKEEERRRQAELNAQMEAANARRKAAISQMNDTLQRAQQVESRIRKLICRLERDCIDIQDLNVLFSKCELAIKNAQLAGQGAKEASTGSFNDPESAQRAEHETLKFFDQVEAYQKEAEMLATQADQLAERLVTQRRQQEKTDRLIDKFVENIINDAVSELVAEREVRQATERAEAERRAAIAEAERIRRDELEAAERERIRQEREHQERQANNRILYWGSAAIALLIAAGITVVNLTKKS